MKKMLSVTLSLLMVFSLFGGVVSAAGSVPEGYTAVSSADELKAAIEKNAEGMYYLTKDITVTEPLAAEFKGELIGNPDNPPRIHLAIGSEQTPFSGKSVGLFQKIANSRVVIQNLIFDGEIYVSVDSGARVGVIAGAAEGLCEAGTPNGWSWYKAKISNCTNYANITVTGGDAVGGFIGRFFDSNPYLKVSNLVNYGNITTSSGNTCGIIAVAHNNVRLSGCQNYGTITSNGTAAGVAAWAYSSLIENCYNAGTVNGNNYSAGIIADYRGDNSKEVKGCINVGAINGSYNRNPVVVLNDNAVKSTYTDCYYFDVDESASVSPVDGISKTTIEALLEMELLPEAFKSKLESLDRPYLLAAASMEGGMLQPVFNKNVFAYEIGLPDDTESFPEPSYILEAPGQATAAVQPASAFGGTATITVTANDGRKRVYTFTIKTYTEMGISEDKPLEVSKPVFTPDSLSGGQQITASSAVINMTPSVKSATLILVASRKNVVIAGAVQKDDAIRTGRKTLQTSVTLPSDLTDVNVTAFVVNNTEELKLLSEPASFADNAAESYTASAEPISVSFKDLKNSILIMTGTPGKAETNYTAIALYPGKTVDFSGNLEDTFAVLTIIKTNAQGIYGIDIGMTGERGEYTFLLLDSETGETIPEKGYPFYFASLYDRESMVKSLYAQTSADGLVSIMDLTNTESDCVKLLGLNAEPFTKGELTPASFSKVLLNIMKENKPAEEDMLERFTEQYNLSILIEKLNQGQIEDIGIYQKEFELSDASMKEYNKLTAEQKKTISTSSMKGNSFVRVRDIDAVLREKAVLLTINGAANAAALRQVIDQQASYLKLTATAMSTYKNLSSPKKTSVAEQLLNSKYNTVADFASAFARAVRDANTSSNTGTSPGSRPSGNGSSSNNVSITPPTSTPTPPPVKTMPFKDLKGYEWAEKAIDELYKKDIVSGVTEESFEPARDVTREEFIKIAASLLETSNVGENLTFQDTDNSAWYAPYLKKAVAAGLAQGKPDGTFGIGEGLTREDMAVIAGRLLKETGSEAGEAFGDDASISDYAKAEVYRLRALGILSGTGANIFEPKRFVTRAEAAQVVYNLMRVSGGNK